MRYIVWGKKDSSKIFWPSLQEIPGLAIFNILWHLKNNERSAVMSIVTPGSPDVMSQRLFGNVIATFGIYTRASSKVFPPPGLLGFVTVHLVKVTVFPFCIIPSQSSRPLGLKEKSMYKDFNVRASSMRWSLLNMCEDNHDDDAYNGYDDACNDYDDAYNDNDDDGY